MSLAVIALYTWASLGVAGSGAPVPDTVPLFEGLGSHHHAITAHDDAVQRYFDQGLRLVYGFNHDEAIRSFEEAIRRDPGCAMCSWGIALALGPNINAAMESEAGARAYEAIQKAMDLAQRASPKERAYIEALARRYGPDPSADRARLDSAYERAMGAVARAYPEDADAGVLHADAIMNLSPWNYWTEDRKPRPQTGELLAELERVLADHPDHAGACHFYIHAVEAAEPDRAIPCADRLPDLMPGAGHIVHMPTHIYIRVGRWADAIERNHHATDADERYIHAERPRGVYPLAYYPHNYDMLTFAATMAGQRSEAVEGARNTARVLDGDMIREPGLGALQHYLVSPLRVMVRFGMWEEILEEPAPPSDLPYPVATWRFARGMALASTGRVEEARRELEALRANAADPAIATVDVWEFNPASALLEIAAGLLAGRIAEATGDLDEAAGHFERALEVERALTYDEPPDWPIPVRHYLGRVLLAAGHAPEAEAVYRADLQQWRHNGFALRGLAEALRAQGEEAEARDVETELAEAWAAADVTPTSSAF